MRTVKTMLLSIPLLCGAAAAQVDSPQAVQETRQLNQDQASQGAQGNAQYQEQLQVYQQQQDDYQAQKATYDAQAQRYLAARDRYAVERARYRRGEWPARYEKLTFVETDALIGAPVETYSGSQVGHVDDVARMNGHIDAVRVALDDGVSHAWVDRGDLKYNPDDRVLITDLAGHDLHSMAAEEY